MSPRSGRTTEATTGAITLRAGDPDPRWRDDLTSLLYEETADELLSDVLTGRLPNAPTPIRTAAGALAGALRAREDHRRTTTAAGRRRQQRLDDGHVHLTGLLAAAITDEVGDVVTAAAAALLDGKPVPTTFTDAIVLARLRTEYAADVTAGHDEVHRWASNAWTAAVHEHRDDVLAGALRTQLQHTLTAVRALAAQPDDPRLADHAFRYDELRTLQEDLLATAFPLGDSYRPAALRLEARVHEFPDVDTTWPDWGFLLLAEDATHAPPPWPRDPVQRVLYAAQHDAWMPTVPETAAAWETTRNAWRARQDQSAAQREQAAAANIRANRIAAGLPPEPGSWRRRPAVTPG